MSSSVDFVSHNSTTLKVIDFTSDGVIKSLLGKVACLVGGVENLVVKHREVQGKTETDGVGWGEIGASDFGCSLVCLQ